MICWNDLREFLNKLDANNDMRLTDTVTIEDDTGEFFAIDDIYEIEETDVLDKGHFYLKTI